MTSDKTPSSEGAAPGREILEGVVERILYTNPDNAYTVAALRPSGTRLEVTIVGNLGSLRMQETVRAEGEWVVDRKYGRQFRVESFTTVLPSTTAGIEKYLASGLIRGIGGHYAKKLVAKFGAEIFEVIENHPERLREVPGIGGKRLDQIRRGWDEHRALRGILMFLQQHNIPQGFAARIYRQYGDRALEQIRRNPYQLALEIRGIGFKSADAIAQKIGIPVESIERCKAGVYFLLQELAGEGHCYFAADPLIERATAALAVEQRLIVEGINALKSEGHIVLEILPDGTRAVYLRQLHHHESTVAASVTHLLTTGKLLPKIDPVREMETFEAQSHFRLAENQRAAVAGALKGGMLVITGGPGTGKTTIIKAVLKILARFGVASLLAAPTGRAAKRMHELTGITASTIHRLLQYSPQEGKFLRNPQNPLRADFVILDESSMIDIGLANSLLRAVSPTTSVLFVGDTDQLPSVGPGNFLMDLINSGVVPVVRLNEIFRQARQSHIVTNAHRINAGNMPAMGAANDPAADFIFIEAETPPAVLEAVKDAVGKRIPRDHNLDPRADIQVITPMHRGPIGAQNLNRELQAMLNPARGGHDRAGVSFKPGDKVMQTANNYEKDVFNGDIGFISSMDEDEQFLRVNFDGRLVTYEFSELDELELAYAITVHKSQGSEYKAVVMPVHTTHFVMLQRNLLYTAITRGRKLVVLVGQKRAVAMAVDNFNSTPRNSALDQRLRREMETASRTAK